MMEEGNGKVLVDCKTHCNKCKYCSSINRTTFCDYLAITGRSRMYEYGFKKKHESDMCDVFEEGISKKVRDEYRKSMTTNRKVIKWIT